jgi:hypothetical protein
VPLRRSLRPVRSDPQLSSTPSPPPQPATYAVYDPKHYVTPDYPSTNYPATSQPEASGLPPARAKR